MSCVILSIRHLHVQIQIASKITCSLEITHRILFRDQLGLLLSDRLFCGADFAGVGTDMLRVAAVCHHVEAKGDPPAGRLGVWSLNESTGVATRLHVLQKVSRTAPLAVSASASHIACAFGHKVRFLVAS